jgi:repressor LexA
MSASAEVCAVSAGTRCTYSAHRFSARDPTDRQREVLVFIHEHTQRHGFPPTLREICKQFGLTSTNGANQHLDLLARKGLLVRYGWRTRAVRITAEGLQAIGVRPCPTCGGLK